MHPNPDGSHQAKSVIFLLDLERRTRRRKSKKPRKSETAEASEVVENDGCAGAICTLDNAVEVSLRVVLVGRRPSQR